MTELIKQTMKSAFRLFGVDIVRHRKTSEKYPELPLDFDEFSTRVFRSVEEHTMTSPERVYSLIEAVKYVVKNGIGGDFVECGVWKGGSVMVMAMTLLEMGETGRDIYLYDTFAGMSSPTDADVSYKGTPARDKYASTLITDELSEWCLSPLEEVRRNVLSTGYPEERFHFIEGKVEETIPGVMPDPIALLRLDTDWYESTKHELVHLYPGVSAGGVVIIDDYGQWQGARKAVDEYIAAGRVRMLLNRIDRTGRIGVKP